MQTICKGLGLLGITCHTEQPSIDVVRQSFASHLSEYGISYGTQEEFEYRFGIYLENDKMINQANGEPNNLVLAHNRFSTMTEYEFKKFLGRKPAKFFKNGIASPLDTSNLSDSVDWRTKGAINPVQNQGMCGSCWAFSAIGSIESSHFIQKGELLKLSEQQLVDCSAAQGNKGCDGGLEIWAFDYAKGTALELESDYPYTADEDLPECKAVADKEKIKVDSYAIVPPKSVDQLKAAIDKQPTSVAVEAKGAFFRFYTGGIMDSAHCGTSLDHAVVAIGYGSADGTDYFIVRNSWGPHWGEEGYIRMAIEGDGSGTCGILMQASRVTSE